MSNRIEGERVFCFECQNEWDRAHGGLQCPRCQSEFVEILSPGSRPPLEDSPPPSSPPRLGPLHEHNPWAVPDPEEDDITTFEFNNRNGGRGTFTFSTRTFTIGGGRNNPHQDPAVDEMSRNFQDMFSHIMGGPNRSRGGAHVFGGTFNIGSQPRSFQHDPFPQQFGLPQEYENQIHHGDDHANELDSLFSLVFESTNAQGRNRGVTGPPHPFDFLQAIFNPANARSGDMVFSQEAFDRVMSQLMEQNNSNGAPPASEDVIKSLPRREVDKTMLGNDGSAECSICMDGVEIGTEVAILPCTHWFHFDCIESWLKEHDTCPHCRKSITPENSTSASSTGRRRRRSSRRSSSVASPMNATMEGIQEIESPSGVRQARERYYGSRRDSDLQRPRGERHGSTRSTGSRDGIGGGSGVGGWIRNHMPF